MSKRHILRMAAVPFLAVTLGGVVHATTSPTNGPENEAGRERDEREVLSYLAPPTPPVEWAFLQGPPPQDGGHRGPGGPPRGGMRGPGRGPGGGRGFNGPVGPGGPMGEGRPPFPPRLLERLREMKPEDRGKVLENNPRFRDLPPERKAELLQRLNMLLDMNEDQRRELDRRLSVFRNLSPEQRGKARKIYEEHWRTLSPMRRMAILEEFRNLRDMNSEQRGKRIASDEYQTQFSIEERAVLDELSAL